jgi:hypothetical protein
MSLNIFLEFVFLGYIYIISIYEYGVLGVSFHQHLDHALLYLFEQSIIIIYLCMMLHLIFTAIHTHSGLPVQ